MRILRILLLFLVATNTGCAIQSTQINALVDLIKEPKNDISLNSWLIRYSNYESIVYAVSTQQGILFSNQDGDRIFFDGWMITRVQGLGNKRLDINIRDKKGVRYIKRGSRNLSFHSCDQWSSEENAGLTRYVQFCEGREGYSNSILVDRDGNIALIRQIVDERYTAMTLTKL